MAHLCKYVSVLGVLTFLKLSSHVSGQMTAEAVYETLSYAIFKMKTDMENLKRRFENIEEKGQRISTTSSPQLAGRPLKEEEMLGFKEYLSLQALTIKKTMAAEKILLRETVDSFEVKFAEFKSEVQKDITSINACLAAFKSEIQKDISTINASLEGKGEAMVDILNRRSSASAKDMTELTLDLYSKTGNISMFLGTMERTMMSNFEDIRTQIANIEMMQKNDGTWNGWGSWSECSSTCGYGMERRERNCSSVTGHLCNGDTTEYQICEKEICPETNSTWNAWGSWSACSGVSDYGMKRRERNCSNPFGYLCNGDNTDYRICRVMPRDCEAIYRNGTRHDGVYDISPDGHESFSVYCDMTNGGWAVIQNRIDDSVPFDRTWIEYETGFGDLQGSHWLGLEKIHRLTRNGSQIRFDMEQVNGSKVYAQYKAFKVDDASTAYKMHVNISGYNGSIPESLSFHNGMKFSTLDRDNDASSSHCSRSFGYGGWWYKYCYRLGNLNGLYGIQDNTGFAYHDHNTYWYLKTASIKLKGF